MCISYLNKQYILDNQGNKIGVFLNMETYQKVLDMRFSDIRAYEMAKRNKQIILYFFLNTLLPVQISLAE